MNLLNTKLKRYAARYMHRETLPNPSQSVISFGFDDCPRSVLESALPLLEAEGWRATIYIAMGLCGTTNHLGKHLSKEEVREIADRGHEIADHTFNHLSASAVSSQAYLADIDRNQDALAAIGVPPSQHFAFPFGHATPDVKSALSCRFLTARGVIPSASTELDSNLLNAMPIYSGQPIEAILERLPMLPVKPQWLNLFGHDVRPNPSDYGCTVPELLRIIAEIKQHKISVQTVGQAYEGLRLSRKVAA